ncbi:NfeD family protein [Xanthobacter sp. KR7-65]|uniref:NfeD family protein n=1 Tax=Xanthobacter sp. KR7-65 TaxID=3156612 RepID=UPI0032B42BD4
MRARRCSPPSPASARSPGVPSAARAPCRRSRPAAPPPHRSGHRAVAGRLTAMPLIADLGPWAWFVLGGVLLVAEIAVPGAFLLWLGLAALITGALAYVVDLSWQIEVLLFAALAVMAVMVGRRISPAPGKASDRPFLNRRAEGLVGRVFTLDEPVVGGVGRIRVDDTVWRVEGPDLAAGSDVRVVSADGATLTVAPANA